MYTYPTIPQPAKSNLKRSQKPIPQNPFTTHRDPVTGKWIVVINGKVKGQLSVS